MDHIEYLDKVARLWYEEHNRGRQTERRGILTFIIYNSRPFMSDCQGEATLHWSPDAGWVLRIIYDRDNLKAGAYHEPIPTKYLDDILETWELITEIEQRLLLRKALYSERYNEIQELLKTRNIINANTY
jgi:hypothetical protein